MQKWALTNGDERKKLANFAPIMATRVQTELRSRWARSSRCACPSSCSDAQEGSQIRLRFALWRDHLPVDSLPLEGWIDLYAVAEEELESNMYSVT